MDSNAWVQHTYDVITELDLVISGMKDADTGCRGYQLTLSEEFLKPYENARIEVYEALSQAQDLTADNASQQARFPQLKSLIDLKFDISAKLIERKRQGKETTSQELLRSKAVMDHLREVVAIMIDAEKTLMSLRKGRTENFGTATPNVVLLAALLGIGFTL